MSRYLFARDLGCKGRQFHQGTPVPEGLYGEAELRDLLRVGHIRPAPEGPRQVAAGGAGLATPRLSDPAPQSEPSVEPDPSPPKKKARRRRRASEA